MARARRKAFVSRALCSSVVAPPSRATMPSQSWVTSDSQSSHPGITGDSRTQEKTYVSAYGSEPGGRSNPSIEGRRQWPWIASLTLAMTARWWAVIARSEATRQSPHSSVALEDFNEPEPFAIELHVLRKRALPGKIVRVQLPPIFERSVALAPVVGEGLVEPPPRQFNCLDDRARPSLAVLHDPSLADLHAFQALARGPASGGLSSDEHEFEQFVRRSRAVAEREAFQVGHGQPVK